MIPKTGIAKRRPVLGIMLFAFFQNYFCLFASQKSRFFVIILYL